jgi:hypothetical protein
MRRYLLLSGLLFGLMSLGHLARTLIGVPIVIYGIDMPRWPSAIAFLITGTLSIWAFRLRGQSQPQ